MKTISYLEYKRRVFNKCLLECIGRVHSMGAGFNESAEVGARDLVDMGRRMSDVFFTDALKLNESTINMTKTALQKAGCCTFMKDCINICESIAEDKADKAAEEEMEIPEDQKIELSDEDEAVIDKLFDEKAPEMQVDAIRDATVTALIAEDKKSQEVKEALDIAQSQVAAGGKPEAMEETVARLSSRGPTSLMNAILNAVSAAAVRDVNESSTKPVSVGKVMSDNKEEIKNRAILMYSLYETSSVLGIQKWTPAQVRAEAERIYFNK